MFEKRYGMEWLSIGLSVLLFFAMPLIRPAVNTYKKMKTWFLCKMVLRHILRLLSFIGRMTIFQKDYLFDVVAINGRQKVILFQHSIYSIWLVIGTSLLYESNNVIWTWQMNLWSYFYFCHPTRVPEKIGWCDSRATWETGGEIWCTYRIWSKTSCCVCFCHSLSSAK